MKRLPRTLLCVCLIAVFLLPSCVFRDEDEEPDLTRVEATVQAFDFYFDPTTVILEPGVEANITLENAGEQTHSFTSPDLDVEIVAEGADTVSTTFVTTEEAGAFEFFCKFHSEMTGVISIGQGEDPTIEDDEDVEVETETEEET